MGTVKSRATVGGQEALENGADIASQAACPCAKSRLDPNRRRMVCADYATRSPATSAIPTCRSEKMISAAASSQPPAWGSSGS